MSTSPNRPPKIRARAVLPLLCLAGLVALLWAFPAFWYAPPSQSAPPAWLTEKTNVQGWVFVNVPISKAAEAILVGDRAVNGDFLSPAHAPLIRVFSIKRYTAKNREIGLFSHTPDRCWTSAGWAIKPVEPQFVICKLHDLEITFERRLFHHASGSELVYFGGLVGGRTLPFRLDQHFRSSLPASGATQSDSANTLARLRSSRVWGWAWDCFQNRTPFGGPQHFIRISTPVQGEDLAAADKRLSDFLPLWLHPEDFQKEFAHWKSSRASGAPSHEQ